MALSWPSLPDRRRAHDGARRHDPGRSSPCCATCSGAWDLGHPITHDLGVVAQVCDRVVVLTRGASPNPDARGVRGPRTYTRGLLNAIPCRRRPRQARWRSGDGAGRSGALPGCTFAAARARSAAAKRSPRSSCRPGHAAAFSSAAGGRVSHAPTVAGDAHLVKHSAARVAHSDAPIRAGCR
jgi:hypothetical protein